MCERNKKEKRKIRKIEVSVREFFGRLGSGTFERFLISKNIIFCALFLGVMSFVPNEVHDSWAGECRKKYVQLDLEHHKCPDRYCFFHSVLT